MTASLPIAWLLSTSIATRNSNVALFRTVIEAGSKFRRGAAWAFVAPAKLPTPASRKMMTRRASLIFIVSGFQGLAHEEHIGNVDASVVIEICSRLFLCRKSRTGFGEEGFNDIKVGHICFSVLWRQIAGIQRQSGKIENRC